MKIGYLWIGLYFFLLICLPSLAFSQDLGNLSKQKPVVLSGSLSLRLNSFSTSDTRSTRDPFFWTVSGSPTLTIYGIAFPFTLAVSNKQKDFRQPFNMYGVSPYYKKIRLHAGYRSVYFSDYTLSDHLFLGGGIEAEPSIFRFGFVYGRFMKAIEPVKDTLASQYAIPSFARKGFAVKLGVGKADNYLDLILLKIQDDTSSLKAHPVDVGVAAASNLVLGIKSRQVIAKIFSFDLDFGVSAYTNDLSARDLTDNDYKGLGFIKNFYSPKVSTQFLTAGKASLGVRIKKMSVKINYRRVEPEYQSMGAYYLNTDLENLTIAPSWQMFKSKLRVNGSLGLQRNNIFKNKINNSVRTANSLSMSYAPNSKWGANINYSNYNMSQTRNYTVVRDTLMMEQFSNNVNGSVYYNFGTKNHKQNVTTSMNYMKLADNTNRNLQSNSTTSVNPTVSYRFNNTDKKFTFNVNTNANNFKTDKNTTFRWGLSSGFSKTLLKDKFKTGTNLSYFSTRLNGAGYSSTISLGGNVGYQPVKGHALTLALNFVNRSFAVGKQTGTTDLLGNFCYTFNF